MIASRTPAAAYTRVEFDARASTAAPAELTAMCYEAVISGLARALIAHDRADNRMKSEALTRTVAALTALQLGVSDTAGVSDALHQFYGAAKHTALDCVLAFDPAQVTRLKNDFREIAQAMASAKPVSG